MGHSDSARRRGSFGQTADKQLRRARGEERAFQCENNEMHCPNTFQQGHGWFLQGVLGQSMTDMKMWQETAGKYIICVSKVTARAALMDPQLLSQITPATFPPRQVRESHNGQF